MRKIIYILASGFGSGYLPKIPGTFGSIVGLILTYFLLILGHHHALLIAFFITLVVGWCCSHVILQEEDQLDPDPSFIVIDEIAGMMLTVLLVLWGISLFSGNDPRLQGEINWHTGWQIIALINAFWTFRLFDIFKPFPIRRIEKKCEAIPELQAVGIMLDDLVAALYAAIIVVPLVILSA
jgi:phosphatidylglycerophosphatase A